MGTEEEVKPLGENVQRVRRVRACPSRSGSAAAASPPAFGTALVAAAARHDAAAAAPASFTLGRAWSPSTALARSIQSSPQCRLRTAAGVASHLWVLLRELRAAGEPGRVRARVPAACGWVHQMQLQQLDRQVQQGRSATAGVSWTIGDQGNATAAISGARGVAFGRAAGVGGSGEHQRAISAQLPQHSHGWRDHALLRRVGRSHRAVVSLPREGRLRRLRQS